MSVPKVTSPPEKVQAAPRAGVAMAVIMTGVLMTAVDTTIVVLALPEIQRGLHVDLSAVVWVIISFLLVITLLATQVVSRVRQTFGVELTPRALFETPTLSGLARLVTARGSPEECHACSQNCPESDAGAKQANVVPIGDGFAGDTIRFWLRNGPGRRCFGQQ